VIPQFGIGVLRSLLQPVPPPAGHATRTAIRRSFAGLLFSIAVCRQRQDEKGYPPPGWPFVFPAPASGFWSSRRIPRRKRLPEPDYASGMSTRKGRSNGDQLRPRPAKSSLSNRSNPAGIWFCKDQSHFSTTRAKNCHPSIRSELLAIYPLERLPAVCLAEPTSNPPLRAKVRPQMSNATPPCAVHASTVAQFQHAFAQS
jgi:hypothetical protein